LPIWKGEKEKKKEGVLIIRPFNLPAEGERGGGSRDCALEVSAPNVPLPLKEGKKKKKEGEKKRKEKPAETGTAWLGMWGGEGTKKP